VRLVQSIQAHDGVMWIMRASADASMIATGGQDGVVRVWRVLQGGQGLGGQGPPPPSMSKNSSGSVPPFERNSSESLEATKAFASRCVAIWGRLVWVWV